MTVNEPAKITVFIPVRNGAQYVGRAIESILGQSIQDIKLEIADNCSTDGTQLAVEKYFSDNRVVLVQRPHDVGMMGNFNACIENVETKYYMVLSHDDFLYSNKALEVGFNILEEHQDIPAVYCETIFVDEHDKAIVKRSFGINGMIESDLIAKKSIISGRNIYGVPLLIRSNALQKNRYDDAFPNSADVDFSIAIGRKKNVYFVNDALIAIRFHKVNNTARIFSSLKKEFLKIAEKYNIKLTKIEIFKMKINDSIVCIQKKIFFLYLDKMRK